MMYYEFKYGNKKITVDGITFASGREAGRYCELKFLERSGEITDLELQKEFVLIPAQYDKKKKCIERACKYVADFCYYDKRAGKHVVEDAKGFKTRDYIIKRKLMLYVHGIRITEV